MVFLSGQSVPLRKVFPLYFSTNIAKYLPGNVMHYVGRNVLGKRLGFSHGDMALSSVLEIALSLGYTAFALTLLVGFGFITLPPWFTIQFDTVFVALAVVFLVGIVGVLLLRRFFPKVWASLRAYGLSLIGLRRSARDWVFFILSTAALSFAGFLLSGLLFVAISGFFVGLTIHIGDFFNVAMALNIAGFASVLTPGVPGGIGIKESVSVVFISAYGYSTPHLVLALLIFRVIFILEELLAFAVGTLMGSGRTIQKPGGNESVDD